MEPIERSETSASNTQTPGDYPKETVLHLQHGENSNLKSTFYFSMSLYFWIKTGRQNILHRETASIP
jgi:hypothetical protein